MKKANHIAKGLIFGLLFGVILLPSVWMPALQKNWPRIQVQRYLSGSYDRPSKPHWVPGHWFSGGFSEEYQHYIRCQHPLRSFFVRLRNQNDLFFFNENENQFIVFGKNSELFEPNYIKAYKGENLFEQALIDSLLGPLPSLHRLMQEQGKVLLVLLPPGKPRIMPQYLPEGTQQRADKQTTWDQYRNWLDSTGVPFMDFAWMKALSDTSQHPIFPQAGLHWSLYGAGLAGEALLDQLASMLGDTLFRPQLTYEIKEHPVDTDAEMERALNLLRALPHKPSFYPRWSEKGQEGKKPHVWVIGDSYYKIWFDHSLHQHAFAEGSRLWYYGQGIYPEQIKEGKRLQAGDFDLAKEYKQSDVILLVNAETNLKDIGFKLLDDLLEIAEVAATKPHETPEVSP